jgi:hypothetical protein
VSAFLDPFFDLHAGNLEAFRAVMSRGEIEYGAVVFVEWQHVEDALVRQYAGRPGRTTGRGRRPVRR